MSKSLGNDISLRGVLDTWGREVVLLLLMTAHWRKPMDFNEGTLEQAKAQLETLPQRLPFRAGVHVGGPGRLEAALDDDFNTPEALALLHGWTLGAGSCCCGAGWSSSVSARWRSEAQAPAEVASSRRGARGTRASDFAERTACATRSGARLGGARHRRRVSGSFRRVTRELVYGRRPVREALRGRREVLEPLGERAGELCAARPGYATSSGLVCRRSSSGTSPDSCR